LASQRRFIAEFNQRFHRETACKDTTAFAPVPAGFDLDTLLAAKYDRKTDNCGCLIPWPPVKKHIVFLFSEKIGFKAYYDKRYYGVKFLDFLNNNKKSHLPFSAGGQTPYSRFFFRQRQSPLTCRQGGRGIESPVNMSRKGLSNRSLLTQS
jgi:hypothetical protein